MIVNHRFRLVGRVRFKPVKGSSISWKQRKQKNETINPSITGISILLNRKILVQSLNPFLCLTKSFLEIFVRKNPNFSLDNEIH